MPWLPVNSVTYEAMSEVCFFKSTPPTENKTDFLKCRVCQIEQGVESCLILGIISPV